VRRLPVVLVAVVPVARVLRARPVAAVAAALVHSRAAVDAAAVVESS